jgi:hypothetical protein
MEDDFVKKIEKTMDSLVEDFPNNSFIVLLMDEDGDLMVSMSSESTTDQQKYDALLEAAEAFAPDAGPEEEVV